MRCGGINNKQKFWRFFFDGIQISIDSTMRRWTTDSPDATFDELAHQAQSLMNLQGGQHRTDTNEEEP